MSVPVRKSSLDRHKRETLLELLHVKGKFNPLTEETPELLFLHTDDEFVYVPYYVSRVLYNNDNQYRRQTDITFRSELRLHQVPIVREAIDQLNEHGTTLIEAPPGAGKTVMGTFLASICKQKTIILVPITTLGPQWMATIKQHTTSPAFMLHERKFSDKDISLMVEAHFIVGYYERLTKVPKHIKDSCGLLILDESHLLARQTAIEPILSVTPKYIVACSATPSRKDGLYKAIQTVTGPHSVKSDERPSFMVVKVNTGVVPATRKVMRAGKMQNDFVFLEKNSYLDVDRNELIIKLCRRLSTRENRSFIMVKRVDHGELLHQTMKTLMMSVGRFMEKDKKIDDCDVLVGMNKKAGTGYDEAAYCSQQVVPRRFMFLVHTINNHESLHQVCGRVFRHTSPVVFDFVDNNYTMQNHWRTTRRPYYLREKAHIVELDACDVDSFDVDLALSSFQGDA